MIGLRFLRGKAKEVALCAAAGRVTLPYPHAPAEAPPSFRGLPTVAAERCIGCGGCVAVCPAGLIEVVDDGPVATFTWHLERCSYCGRCAEVCPEEAATLSREFETATDDLADLAMLVEVFMGSCNRCGRCYRTQTPLDPPAPRAVHEARVAALCDRWREEGT